MLTDQLAIPEGSRILVTGANSYLGSNIIDLLLELGYNVRGTVRGEKPWLDRLFEEKFGKGRFEALVTPSLEEPGAFDHSLLDVAGVVHVASDVSFNPDPNVVVTPVVAATINALQAASKCPSVKRFVLTSSSSAALTPPAYEKLVVTEGTWNDAAVAAAWSKHTPPDPVTVYAASKTEGERAAWKWVKENQPGFIFNSVLPNWLLGRILAPEIPGSSMGWVRKLTEGDDGAMQMPPQWYVDVQDTARLHAIALLAPAIQNERIFAFAAPFNWTDVVAVLRNLRPQRKIPDSPENERRDLADIKPSKRAESLLEEYFGQSGWTVLEDSLADGIAAIE